MCLMSVRKEFVMIKNITLRLLVLLFITGIFASCWDNFEERDFYSANILTFSFAAQDTCPDIEDYVFNIDQFKGLIYNLDSLPYGSKVDYLVPTLTFQSSDGNVYINDSLWDSSDDTLDFTSPVIIKNTSSDGSITRSYKINVNVHQVDPDSMQFRIMYSKFPTDSPKCKVIYLSDGSYKAFFDAGNNGITVWRIAEGNSIKQTVSGISEEMNIQSLCVFDSKYYISSNTGKLYVSTDGLSWSHISDGLNFVTLYGSINRKYIYETSPAYLIGLVRNASGDICFARSSDGISWTTGSTIDSDFPVKDYAYVKGKTATGIQFYTIATGLISDGDYSTSLWSTENGLDWVLIQKKVSNAKYFAANRTGASMFYYDNYLVCMGGLDSKGNYVKDIYVSKDQGKAWIKAPDNWILDPVEEGLAYGSAYIERIEDTVNDKDREFIMFFGGQNSSGTSPVVWKGYLNKMLFARR
jgi:hypothetical protein